MNNLNDNILPKHINYCFPKINEIKFISDKQTMSLVLGSCISTLFIGKTNDSYILAANHIAIAEPIKNSTFATKGALEQINEILNIFSESFTISNKNIIHLYLLGAGTRMASSSFRVHIDNIKISKSILKEKKYYTIFQDTMRHITSNFSIKDNLLSIFIEDIDTKEHISFIIKLDKLFKLALSTETNSKLPAISLISNNNGFEYLVDKNIITFITGTKDRLIL